MADPAVNTTPDIRTVTAVFHISDATTSSNTQPAPPTGAASTSIAFNPMLSLTTFESFSSNAHTSAVLDHEVEKNSSDGKAGGSSGTFIAAIVVIAAVVLLMAGGTYYWWRTRERKTHITKMPNARWEKAELDGSTRELAELDQAREIHEMDGTGMARDTSAREDRRHVRFTA